MSNSLELMMRKKRQTHLFKVRIQEEEQRKQLPSSLSDLGKGVVDSPHLTLVSQSIFTTELQLRVQALLLERATRGGISFAN